MPCENITVIYATSPHRYGDSTAMLNISIETIREFGFKDCPIVICADGINPDSHYSEPSKAAAYKNYLSNIQTSFPKETLLVSDKHLGLTKNYLQAWDKRKVKTDYCFMMNHDVAISPDFKKLNLKAILKDFPSICKILFFPRDETDFWERSWFSPVQDIALPKEWNAARALGFQDNACILRKKTFPEYVKKYYDEKDSPYIEDTIHAHMKSLKPEDLRGWKKYGAVVWLDALSFHLDGQSKAGNKEKPEKVWSTGSVFPENIKKLRAYGKTSKSSAEFILRLEQFLDQEFKMHQEKGLRATREFQSALINLVAFTRADEDRFKSKNDTKEKKECDISAELRWETIDEGNYVLRLTHKGKVLFYGGHGKESALIDYEKHGLTGKESLDCKFELYGADGFRKKSYEPFIIYLSKRERLPVLKGNNGPFFTTTFCTSSGELLAPQVDILESISCLQKDLLNFWNSCSEESGGSEGLFEGMRGEVNWWKARVARL